MESDHSLGSQIRRQARIFTFIIITITISFVRSLFITQELNNLFPRKDEEKSENTTKEQTTALQPRKVDASVRVCPPESANLSFTTGLPQNLTFGRFREQKGRPFLTQDFWADIVDNKRTFFLRPFDPGMPSMEQLRDWIRSRPHPITLVMNNNHAKSWPDNLNNRDYELVLNETNLHSVFALNARRFDDYPKLKPLPLGPKWNWRSRTLFSEAKTPVAALYRNYTADTPEAVAKLFRSNQRTPTVYLRHMSNSNRGPRSNYIRDTPALKAVRHSSYPRLNSTLQNSLRVSGSKVAPSEYFADLKKHRFFINPSGKGLDTHSTWEGLMAGCIPIMPNSPLAPLFEDLPVWLVDSWAEVTDENMVRKQEEFLKDGKEYKWEKLFVSYWEKEIHRGLCKSE